MNETTETTTVNDVTPEQTGSDKDYAKLYENSKAEIARKEAKYKADMEAIKNERDELEAYRKEKATREEKDKISKWKQNEIIEEMKTKFADYDSLLEFKQNIIKEKEAVIEKQLAEIPEVEKEFVSKVLSNASTINEKQELLEWFTKRFWEKKDRWKEPAQKQKATDPTELEVLESKKESGTLTPSEKVKYMTLLNS